MAQKRFYWLKLPTDFFRDKSIKKLRQIAGGDTYTIIYLKLLLKSLDDDGKLYYDGLESDFASEMALDIDETAENVEITVQFLLARGILVQNSVTEYELLTAAEMTGSEGDSARRMRELRERRNLELTSGASQCDVKVTVRDIEKEKEIDKEKSKSKTFIKPTIEQVQEYCESRHNGIDARAFVDYYEAVGWTVGKKPMRDWMAAVRTWERNRKPTAHSGKSYSPDGFGG